MSDRQLMDIYRESGDVRAFEAFVLRHEQGLISFARRILRDEFLAQDVVQDAFMKAAKSSGKLVNLNGVSALRKWMLKVVHDLCVDRFRKRAGEQRAVTGKALQATPHAEPADAESIRRERMVIVRTAIDSLKPRWRELVFLKVYEHLTYREIAEITGLTATNVGYLLHQAMKELKRSLQSQNAEEQ